MKPIPPKFRWKSERTNTPAFDEDRVANANAHKRLVHGRHEYASTRVNGLGVNPKFYFCRAVSTAAAATLLFRWPLECHATASDCISVGARECIERAASHESARPSAGC